MTTYVSKDTFEQVHNYIERTKRYMRMFIILAIGTWVSGFYLIFSNTNPHWLGLVLAALSLISVVMAFKAWKEKFRVERNLERFGYAQALNPEEEGKEGD